MKKISTLLFVACVIIPINAGTWMTLSQIDNALGHTSSSNTELGMYGTDVLILSIVMQNCSEHLMAGISRVEIILTL